MIILRGLPLRSPLRSPRLSRLAPVPDCRKLQPVEPGPSRSLTTHHSPLTTHHSPLTTHRPRLFPCSKIQKFKNSKNRFTHAPAYRPPCLGPWTLDAP